MIAGYKARDMNMFSIITPVFNSSQYLDKCIMSVVMQTLPNWEMVLVDDGSSDNSWEVIQSFIRKDNRIRGIKQVNAGPGAARNAGIKEAYGDYVVFLDSDDYLDCDYLELLEPKAKNNDVVFIDVLQVDDKGRPLKEEKMSKFQSLAKDEILRAMMTGKIPWGGCRKSVSLLLLKEHDIKYSNLRIGEEALFSFRALEAASTIGFLSEKLVYMYVNHDGSQSKLKLDDPWGETFEEMREYLLTSNLYEKYADTLNALNTAATVISIDRISSMNNGKLCKEKIFSRLKRYHATYDSKYGLDTKSLSYKAKIFIPFLRIGWGMPINLVSRLRNLIR